jgi:hypothetical protein
MFLSIEMPTTMKKNTYTLTQEPELDVYSKLLDYALTRCSLAYFVVRPDMALSEQGKALLRDLEPHMRNKVNANEWPGTQLVDGTAIVHYFIYDAESAEILKKNATRLFEWVQPDLPEDLGLLRSIENPWLITIGHESDGYFLLDDVEMADLVTSVPEIQRMIRKDKSPP